RPRRCRGIGNAGGRSGHRRRDPAGHPGPRRPGLDQVLLRRHRRRRGDAPRLVGPVAPQRGEGCMDLMTWLRAEWDRVLGFGLIALGAVLLVLGYLGVSNSPYVAEQLSYIVSGGLGGLFLLGAGATLLILADLHDEWRKLDRVEAMLSGEIPFPAPAPAPAEANGVGRAPAPSGVAGPSGGPVPAAAPAPATARPARLAEARPVDAGAAAPPATRSTGPGAAAVFRRERFSL